LRDPAVPAAGPQVESEPAAAPEGEVREHTYGQILKSSVLIGGSQAFNVVIGVVRSKAMAVLLGPAGFGLMGLYTSIINLAQSIAGMGVNSSGVRQIAAAVGSGETARVARTAAVLRRTSVVLGVLGALLLIGLSGYVSNLTFDTYERAIPVALLSLAILFRVVSDGQSALIQGLRRIPDLAKVAALGGLLGTGACIALVYFFRERGVVPSLIAMAAATLFLSWRYSRRAGVASPALTLAEVRQETMPLLKLGFAFMASGVLIMGAAYAVRIVIVRQIGLDAAGLYQAAWTIGGLYVGFILQAMGADFYPRLTAVVKDRAECNRLVNEQAHVSLLLAGPGVIATLTLAPLMLSLLYSAAFQQAVQLLRWICLGATLQVITWPLGFIIVAEARQGLFLAVELAYTIVYVALSAVLVPYYGVNGAGVAFFASYIFHGLMLYPVVHRLTRFRWSSATGRLAAVLLLVIGLVFTSALGLPSGTALAVGLLALLLTALYSACTLLSLVPQARVPPAAARLLAPLCTKFRISR
jgi:O-antigen/teichoic acid export membrane protein